MIVVDTNVISYLLIQGEHSAHSRAVLRREPIWIAPLLWRSEFRNVLATYMRQRVLSSQVLSLASTSRCSAYDCEFVALACQLDLPLVTTDRDFPTEFAPLTIRPEDFCSH